MLAMSITGEVRRPGVVSAACAMLALGGLLYAGEIYLAEQRFLQTSSLGGAAGAVATGFHWLVEVAGMFAGVGVAVLAVPAFLGLNWSRAVIWVFGLPMLIWYGLAAFLSLFDTATRGPAYATVWPSWLDTLDTVLTAAAAVLLIGALVGQTVPAADAYFRRDFREKAL
jgi:hypothetical protein